MAETGQKLECDLVMRGGITSGIVYPCAIAKLAETYRFRSIGGTSAGAVRRRPPRLGHWALGKGRTPSRAASRRSPRNSPRKSTRRQCLSACSSLPRGSNGFSPSCLRACNACPSAARLLLLALRSGGCGNCGHSAYPRRLVARAWLGCLCRSPCSRGAAARSIRRPRRGKRPPFRCAVPPAQE